MKCAQVVYPLGANILAWIKEVGRDPRRGMLVSVLHIKELGMNWWIS